MSQQYTDHLNNPIDVGDIVVRSITSGYGSSLVFERVEEIIPLVERPGTWLSTGPNSRVPLVREDQVNKKNAAEYHRRHFDYETGEYVQSGPEKCYVLRTRRLNSKRGRHFWDPKKVFVAVIDNVVVVTGLAQGLRAVEPDEID